MTIFNETKWDKEFRLADSGVIFDRFCLLCDDVTMQEKDGNYLTCTVCSNHRAGVALENENIRRALSDRDDAKVEQLLKEEF